MPDTDRIKKAALWDTVGKPLFEPVKKIMPFVVAVIVGGGAVLWLRDKTSGVPNGIAATADATQQLTADMKSVNMAIGEMRTEIKTLQGDLTSMKVAVGSMTATLEAMKSQLNRLEDKK